MRRALGLIITIAGIAVIILSSMELDNLRENNEMSEDSPPEIRSLLEVPRYFLSFALVAGFVLVAGGAVKYLKDMVT